jgi:ATPase family associated with various cellular activities (AAA)
MSQKENKELQELVRNYKPSMRIKNHSNGPDYYDEISEKDHDDEMLNLCQWTTGDNRRFIPSGSTKKSLPPGVYEIHQSSTIGLYFEKFPVRTEGLIRFPQTNSEKVLNQIDTFWNREHIFKEYKLPHKRGILLWGPPGGGKTCTVNLIMKDVVEDRQGIVIKFTHPSLFLEGMRVLRAIEKDTPVVVLMEDIDAILESNDESQVLNILDGVESVQKVVFLATTNYPERLGPRVVNRPSRFDKRYKIGYPDQESRTIYFKHLCGAKSPEELGINLTKWVTDTEDFSIAHLKELFVAVVILGDTYTESLEDLKEMGENISSEHDESKTMNLFKKENSYDDNCKSSRGLGY